MLRKIHKLILFGIIICLKIYGQTETNDVHIYPQETIEQTEISIAINPTNPLNILVGVNGNVTEDNEGEIKSAFQPTFYTTDGGKTWYYTDHSPWTVIADPVVFFDVNGNGFRGSIATDDTGRNIQIIKTTDGGLTWGEKINVSPVPNSDIDKEHIIADLSGL